VNTFWEDLVTRNDSLPAYRYFEGFYVARRYRCKGGDIRALDFDAGFEQLKAAFKMWGSNAERIVPVLAKQAISKKQAAGAGSAPREWLSLKSGRRAQGRKGADRRCVQTGRATAGSL
jgi:hypothetical protein